MVGHAKLYTYICCLSKADLLFKMYWQRKYGPNYDWLILYRSYCIFKINQYALFLYSLSNINAMYYWWQAASMGMMGGLGMMGGNPMAAQGIMQSLMSMRPPGLDMSNPVLAQLMMQQVRLLIRKSKLTAQISPSVQQVRLYCRQIEFVIQWVRPDTDNVRCGSCAQYELTARLQSYY